MRRAIWIVLLGAGTVLGFGTGFAHLAGYGPCGHFGHGPHGYGFRGHEGVEERAADACVRAAERVLNERRTAPPPPPAAPAPTTPPSSL